jgi:hypothetical protein
MADITYTRPEVADRFDLWQLVSDACEGEYAVKAQGDVYLPRPNAFDTSQENQSRYDQYLARAVYYNATGRTLTALTGIAFRRWPEIVLPEGLDYLRQDASGSGVTLIQSVQGGVQSVLKAGRAGLLTDYPTVQGGVSRAANLREGVQATITRYDADSIVNWRTERVGGKQRLSLVVLSETFEQPDDYGSTTLPQYRELALIDGAYIVRIWRQAGSKWAISEEYVPRNASGGPWREIPFTFVGAIKNDPSMGPIPLYDLAVLNLAHYRNSADFEDSVYLIGQPQPWMSGLDEAWRDHMEERGIYLGSRAPWLLPANGQAGLMQAEPNNLARQAMIDKQEQMASLGARLLDRSGAVSTAYEAESDDNNAHSVLSLTCDNVSSAYTQALQWAGEMMGARGETSLSIPTDFAVDKLDAPTLTALLAAVQAGKVPESDFWAALREAGFIDSEKTDDEIREELNAAGTNQGDLTDVLDGTAAA